MVDSIGATSVNGGQAVTRVQSVTPAQTVQSARPPVDAAPSPASQLTGVARELAAKPPVDMERVAEIKRAIATGKFPILPSTIADRLIALRLQWNPNDKA